MKVHFTVPGEPQGKGRPRFTARNGRAFARTPEKTAIYENLIKMEYQSQCKDVRFQDKEPLYMEVAAYYTIPASTSKKKKAEMQNKILRPVKKPDWDNIGKVVADSLNQIAYRDDAQIVEAVVKKYYSDVPRIEVTIRNEEE